MPPFVLDTEAMWPTVYPKAKTVVAMSTVPMFFFLLTVTQLCQNKNTAKQYSQARLHMYNYIGFGSLRKQIVELGVQVSSDLHTRGGTPFQ